jgi:hypothetical protein
MSTVLKSILSFIYWIREANHAADLARNGKIEQAQDCYKK